tara:strand:- start:52 stop:951 length:900 start_codon:yes stop_codon:yes gene_type:complete
MWSMNMTNVPPPDVRYLRVTGGMQENAGCWQCHAIPPTRFETMYRFLFKPAHSFAVHIRQLRATLFGPSRSYNSMHIRMGDSSEGSNMKSSFLWRMKDQRSTLAQAAEAVACAAGLEPDLPFFVATDNALLKDALAARDPRRLNATVFVDSGAFANIVTHGCTGCMVNAVQKQRFDGEGAAEGVRAIFVDQALLAGARHFVYMPISSNYAGWTRAWRDELDVNTYYPTHCGTNSQHCRQSPCRTTDDGKCLPSSRCSRWRNQTMNDARWPWRHRLQKRAVRGSGLINGSNRIPGPRVAP